MTTIPRRLYWWVLAVTIVAGVLLWVFALVYAANKASQERDRLCLVLYALINRSGNSIGKKGSPGYAYYRRHPVELEKAREQNVAFLAALPCQPNPPPPPLRTGTEGK